MIKFYEITCKLNYCVVLTFIKVLEGSLSVSKDTAYNLTRVVAWRILLHFCTSLLLKHSGYIAYSMVTHSVCTHGPKFMEIWVIIIWNKYENNTINVSAL